MIYRIRFDSHTHIQEHFGWGFAIRARREIQYSNDNETWVAQPIAQHLSYARLQRATAPNALETSVLLQKLLINEFDY